MKKICIGIIVLLICLLPFFTHLNKKKTNDVFLDIASRKSGVFINGDYLTYVNINDDYIEEGAKAFDEYGRDISSNVSIIYHSNNKQVSYIDTRYVNNYLVTYRVNDNGKIKEANRVVIIGDTEGPMFESIDTKVITTLEAATFDVSDGVKVYDNSLDTTLSCDNSLAMLPGSYSIVCRAFDKNGNVSEKKRLIKVIDGIKFNYDDNLTIIFPTSNDYIYKYSLDGGATFIECSSKEDLNVKSGSVIAAVYFENEIIFSNVFVF